MKTLLIFFLHIDSHPLMNKPLYFFSGKTFTLTFPLYLHLKGNVAWMCNVSEVFFGGLYSGVLYSVYPWRRPLNMQAPARRRCLSGCTCSSPPWVPPTICPSSREIKRWVIILKKKKSQSGKKICLLSGGSVVVVFIVRNTVFKWGEKAGVWN